MTRLVIGLARNASDWLRLTTFGTPSRVVNRSLLLYKPFASAASNRKYAPTHEWIQVQGDVGTVGISKHAADELGEVVYADLPEKGIPVQVKSSFGAVESVKAASDVYAPISGQVVDTNAKLKEDPTLINSDPLGAGWLIKLKIQDPKELDLLMDEATYHKTIGENKND